MAEPHARFTWPKVMCIGRVSESSLGECLGESPGSLWESLERVSRKVPRRISELSLGESLGQFLGESQKFVWEVARLTRNFRNQNHDFQTGHVGGRAHAKL